MRKIIAIILVLIGFSSLAQTPPRTGYLVQTAKWKFTNPVWLDSGAYITKISKNSNQNRYLVYDSLTGKVHYRYVSAASQTPWTTDIYGNGKSLSNVNIIGTSELYSSYVECPSIASATSLVLGAETTFELSTNLGKYKFDVDGDKATFGILDVSHLSNNRNYRMPDTSGTVAIMGKFAVGTGTVTSVSALTLGTSGTDLSSTVANSTTTPVITLNVPTASASNRGVLSSTDWSTFNNKQSTLSLTTTGTSGAATLVGSTLNVPQYSGTTYTGGNGIIVSGSTIYRDSIKSTGQYGNTWGNGMYLGSSNNRSVKFYSNSLLRGQLDSNGRWGFGTMKPIAPVHIGVAGSGRQKVMFIGEPGFISTYGHFIYSDANSGDLSVWGYNNSIESTTSSLYINRSTGAIVLGATTSTIGNGRLTIPIAPTASANYGQLNMSNLDGYFNGTGTGKFVGASTGQYIAINSIGSVAYNYIMLQKNGVNRYQVDSTGKETFASTITAGGTTGNQTINKPSGTVNIAASGTSVTITNSLVSTSSIVFAVVRTSDGTAYIKNVVPSSGSFVITLGAAATSEVSIGFIVYN